MGVLLRGGNGCALISAPSQTAQSGTRRHVSERGQGCPERGRSWGSPAPAVPEEQERGAPRRAAAALLLLALASRAPAWYFRG